MDINNFYDLMQEYALDNENYKKWREMHGETFGDVFLSAFEDSPEAQIRLTSALIKTTKREFEGALANLLPLEYFCNNNFDSAALCYFIGLHCEFLQNEEQMTEYYEKILDYGQDFLFNIAFHPYYRTAKFAQRESKCEKAIKYYKKAMQFYSESEQESEKKKILSQLNYEIATVYMYMHEYEKGSFFIQCSFDCDKTQNPQRNYVLAILCALDEKHDMLKQLLDSMPGILKMSCLQMTNAILNKTDLHYCIVKQNREKYKDFWQNIKVREQDLLIFVKTGEIVKAEEIISQYLTQAMPFMNKELVCSVEKSNKNILVKCKDYYTKTLVAEYEALFSMKDESLENWVFISVNEFFEE